MADLGTHLYTILHYRWYRGRLLEKVDSGWKIFFIDYGECKIVSECDIKPLPDAFCVLPAQAIECSLAHVQPLGENNHYKCAEKIIINTIVICLSVWRNYYW